MKRPQDCIQMRFCVAARDRMDSVPEASYSMAMAKNWFSVLSKAAMGQGLQVDRINFVFVCLPIGCWRCSKARLYQCIPKQVNIGWPQVRDGSGGRGIVGWQRLLPIGWDSFKRITTIHILWNTANGLYKSFWSWRCNSKGRKSTCIEGSWLEILML